MKMPDLSQNAPQTDNTPQNGGKPVESQNGRHVLGGRFIPVHGRDQARFKLAKDAIETGKTVPQAMRLAGYAESTVNQSKHSLPTKAALEKFRDNFLNQFAKTLKKQGCGGEGMAKRLAKVINGSDDYNATQAVRVGATIILKNTGQNALTASFSGIFVVPEAKSAAQWEIDAKELQAIQVETMIKDAEVIES